MRRRAGTRAVEWQRRAPIAAGRRRRPLCSAAVAMATGAPGPQRGEAAMAGPPPPRGSPVTPGPRRGSEEPHSGAEVVPRRLLSLVSLWNIPGPTPGMVDRGRPQALGTVMPVNVPRPRGAPEPPADTGEGDLGVLPTLGRRFGGALPPRWPPGGHGDSASLAPGPAFGDFWDGQKVRERPRLFPTTSGAQGSPPGRDVPLDL